MAFKMKGFSGFKSSPVKFGGAMQAASRAMSNTVNRSNTSERRDRPKKMWSSFFERFLERRRRKQERPQE